MKSGENKMRESVVQPGNNEDLVDEPLFQLSERIRKAIPSESGVGFVRHFIYGHIQSNVH